MIHPLIPVFLFSGRVSINPHVSCSTCPSCTRGLTQFCDLKSQSFIGVYRNGGWSQYTRVQANHVHVLPPQISLRHAVLAEPVSCIIHGLNLLKPLPTDSKILVHGVNTVGCLWLCILHHYGYRKVVVCDPSDRRRHLATGLRLGYDVTYPEAIDDESYEGLRQDRHWGFDALIDCTSASNIVQKAVKWMRNGGKILLFGCYPQNIELKISPHDIISKELKLFGCQSNPFTFPQALQLIRDMGDRYLDFTKHGIALYPLINYEEAFSALAKEKVMKVVFET